MIEPQKFVRKALYVDAVRVTQQNLEEVATWCQGEIKQNEVPGRGTSKKHIKLRVHNPKNQRQTKAFMGDWILYTPRGYKIYTNKAFRDSFDGVEPVEKISIKAEREYPYSDGPVLVLGPECFIAQDGSVLSWRGMNYVPQTTSDREGGETEEPQFIKDADIKSVGPVIGDPNKDPGVGAILDVKDTMTAIETREEQRLPVDDSPEHRAAIERMKADAGIGEGAQTPVPAEDEPAVEEQPIPAEDDVVAPVEGEPPVPAEEIEELYVDETTPQDMGLVSTSGPIASSSQDDRATFENKDLGDPPTGESIQPGDEVAVKADEQARMAEGKRVLSIEEQATMASEDIRALLQSGEAVLAQDLVA